MEGGWEFATLPAGCAFGRSRDVTKFTKLIRPACTDIGSTFIGAALVFASFSLKASKIA